MTQLKNYLTENNISVKEFAKITKVKEKKLNRVLENQAFFNENELQNVSAFLGVSKNELFHGVIERKGELPEVAEQNNLNHFRYFIKNKFKNAKNLINFLEVVYGLSTGATAVMYVAAMFMGITGLPTMLRSVSTMLCCFIIPTVGLNLFWTTAFNKVFKKRSLKENQIKIEGSCISVFVLLYTITGFIKDFIPAETLVFSIVASVALSALTIIPLFKSKPFSNRIVHFVVFMIPTILMIVASYFMSDHIDKLHPTEESFLENNLATASFVIGLVYYVLIIGVFGFSLMLFYNFFVEGLGKYFQPMKKEKSNSKKRLSVYVIGCIVLCGILFAGICGAQGMVLKQMYSSIFEGQEESINWTSEFVTDYETKFKKGEYDIVKYESIKIKIPNGYSVDKKTEYTTIYKKDEDHIIFSKPISVDSVNFDLFDEDFGEGKITKKQKEEMKENFVKYFGIYPTNMYEWQKLEGSVTLDDIDIFNPQKTALMSTVFIMKAVATVPNSQYYLYENGDLYATIIIHTIKNEEKGDREMVDVSFGTPDLEYNFSMMQADQDNNVTIEEVTKILNSIEMD